MRTRKTKFKGPNHVEVVKMGQGLGVIAPTLPTRPVQSSHFSLQEKPWSLFFPSPDCLPLCRHCRHLKCSHSPVLSVKLCAEVPGLSPVLPLCFSVPDFQFTLAETSVCLPSTLRPYLPPPTSSQTSLDLQSAVQAVPTCSVPSYLQSLHTKITYPPLLVESTFRSQINLAITHTASQLIKH